MNFKDLNSAKETICKLLTSEKIQRALKVSNEQWTSPYILILRPWNRIQCRINKKLGIKQSNKICHDSENCNDHWEIFFVLHLVLHSDVTSMNVQLSVTSLL